VGVHRSRYELERILGRYGASDFAFVEADARASIQFAMHGRYVQLALPLPDPTGVFFTHTPTGRPRAIVAQERAYEQALREHWRALVLAVRGKLQSVESGISTFEEEFKGFLVPQFHEEKGKRRAPKAVNWLLGSSHTLAIGLVAAFFVPASAVGAFALPPNVVDHLSAPFQSSAPGDRIASSDASRAITAGSSNWTRGNTGLAGNTFVSALGDSTSRNQAASSGGSGQRGPTPAIAVTAPALGGNDVPTSAPAPAPSGGGQSNNPGPASSGSVSSADSPSAPPPPSRGGSNDNTSVSAGNSSSNAGSTGGDQPSAGGTTHPPDGGAVGDSGAPAEGAQGSGGQPTKSGDGGSQSPAGGGTSSGGTSGGGNSTGGSDGGKTPPPTGTGTPSSTTPTPHDNGNHNGADNSSKTSNSNKSDSSGNSSNSSNSSKTDSSGNSSDSSKTDNSSNSGNSSKTDNSSKTGNNSSKTDNSSTGGNGNAGGNGNGNTGGNGKDKPPKGKP
jgi:hypothetical protein